jgi:hypothetical protein
MTPPDSDAREVRHAFTPRDAPVCVVCGLCRDEHRNPSVSLPLSIAQRILAVLEHYAHRTPDDECEALADELRSLVTK